MTSSASSIIAGALIPGTVLAQGNKEETQSLLQPKLEQRISEAVADLWGLRAEQIRLKWGNIKDPSGLSDQTAFRLVGRGLDGWFAVVFDRGELPDIAARLRAGYVDSVMVAKAPLRAGARIRRADVVTEERIVWSSPLTASKVRPVVGWLVKRPIAVGEIIAPPGVTAPPLVTVGEKVKLTWKRGLITVTVEGTALGEAAMGEYVRVKLDGGRGHAKAIVTGRRSAALES